jgi:hypothetical protein
MQQYLQASAAAAHSWYDADGHWISASRPPDTRERLWISSALYANGEHQFADTLIRRGDTTRYGDHCFDIFDNNIAITLLLDHREDMAPDVRQQLEGLVRDGFAFKPGNRAPDFQFHGYNDNMPAAATMGLILGGELLGQADAVAHGVWNLQRLRALLTRRGVVSEFNSPTYSSLSLHALGMIAEYAREEEVRTLARSIEARLWLDLAARFHPETGILAGPYSRAYTIDTIGHLSCVGSILWFLLGERIPLSPMALFTPSTELVLHTRNNYPFNIAQMCCFATGVYHLPDEAVGLFAGKHYPFRAVASSEQGDWGIDFPGRPCRVDTVLHADYTLGTSSTILCGGEHTLNYFVTYRRRDTVKSFRDVGTVLQKMVVNDDVPGMIGYGERTSATGEVIRYANAGEDEMLVSKSNATAMQTETTALLLSHPHLGLGGIPDEGFLGGGQPPREMTRLSEMVIFPSHFGGADEILVGGKPREDWSGEVQRGEWIACRRGRLLIAIRPLAYSCTLGPVRITLERHNNYEVIRTTFYQGEPRIFTRRELGQTFGGFIAEHAGMDEYPNLAAFADEFSQAAITDYYWATRCARYLRPAGVTRPALDMEVSWSPGSVVPRFATIDGQPVEMPIVQIDGIDATQLPFLSERAPSIPPYFPWDDFSVVWGDWPSAIGERGIV